MNVTHKIFVDLTRREKTAPIEVVQDEKYSRTIEFGFRSGFGSWYPPEDAVVLVRYRKPDGTCGEYDTLPDGSRAYSISGNHLCVTLAPQVLTVEGTVEFGITLISQTRELTVYQGQLNVSGKIPMPEESENYFSITGFIPQPKNAAIGQYLAISGVNENGKVTEIQAVDKPQGESGTAPSISMERFEDETGSGVRLTATNADSTYVCPVYDGKDGQGIDAEIPENMVTCDLDGATEDESAVPVNADTLGGKNPAYYAQASDVVGNPGSGFAQLTSGTVSSGEVRFERLGNVIIARFHLVLGQSVAQYGAASVFTIPREFCPSDWIIVPVTTAGQTNPINIGPDGSATLWGFGKNISHGAELRGSAVWFGAMPESMEEVTV